MFEKPLEPLNDLIASRLLECHYNNSWVIGELLSKRMKKVTIRCQNCRSFGYCHRDDVRIWTALKPNIPKINHLMFKSDE